MHIKYLRRLFPSAPMFDVTYVIALFVITRLALYCIAAGAYELGRPDGQWFEEPRSDLHRGDSPGALVRPLIRWDALFYVALAREGYPERRADGGPVFHAAFFPAYPLVVRALDRVLGDTFAASLIVSNGSTVLALAMLVLSSSFGRRAQRRKTATVALVFPGSHFLSLPYTEGPFLLLLVLALHFLHKKRLLVTGLIGALATSTRSTGIAIPLMIVASTWRRPAFTERMRGLVAAVMGTGGLIAYSVFCYQQYGDWKYYSTLQPLWGREFSLLGPLRAIFAFNHDPDYYLVLIATTAAVVWGWSRMSDVFRMLAVVLLLLPLSTGTLKSMIRFQAINIPAFSAISSRLSGAWLRRWIWLSFGLLAYEVARYSAGFANN